MAIIVVCTGCRKSFKVSDKFAGKSGPCPNCKKTLQVPAKGEEVTVHAPEAFAGGGRSASGKLIIKPISRVEAKIRPIVIAIAAVAVVLVLLGTWVAGRNAKLFDGTPGLLAAGVGLLLVSPPLVIAAYRLLRDDELEPFSGRSLYIRSAICSIGYVALWGVFAMVSSMGLITGDVWNWAFVLPPFILVGGAIAFASLDLEFGNALFHYSFYLLATLALRWAAGMPWTWNA
ncbi:MAG: hypothetical protein ABFC96_03990 [Thermoguttaceae bacterium]